MFDEILLNCIHSESCGGRDVRSTLLAEQVVLADMGRQLAAWLLASADPHLVAEHELLALSVRTIPAPVRVHHTQVAAMSLGSMFAQES